MSFAKMRLGEYEDAKMLSLRFASQAIVCQGLGKSVISLSHASLIRQRTARKLAKERLGSVFYFCRISCRTNLKLNSVPAGYSICSLKVLEVV